MSAQGEGLWFYIHSSFTFCFRFIIQTVSLQCILEMKDQNIMIFFS